MKRENLEVFTSKDSKFSKQSLLEKNKANLMLGITNKGVLHKSAEVISKLYRSYVRLHLEYCIQFWAPVNVKDANTLEGVQRRAAKTILSLRNIIRRKTEKVGYVFFKEEKTQR